MSFSKASKIQIILLVLFTMFNLANIGRFHGWNSNSDPFLPCNRLPASALIDQPNDSTLISVVQEEVFARPNPMPYTPNFYDRLRETDCVPDKTCSRCLADTAGDSCGKCNSKCSCYCEELRSEKTLPKFVAKRLSVSLPVQKRDPDRLIPRIVHQTWKENVAKDTDTYPNLSRLVESFRQSGFDYRFYNDTDCTDFISTHFPPEVREAYDALIPGAYKADMFRYCVLLIYGGVYADIDVLLESTLDLSIPPDVGFMTPMGRPEKNQKHGLCLWNGFMAAAPGHPVLAKALETVVNQVRNRFTNLDIDESYRPVGDLTALHVRHLLFLTGPCLLGASLNRALGRYSFTGLVPGELHLSASHATSGLNESEGTIRSPFPGRTIILQQNVMDMGANRFVWPERNLVIAATLLPNSQDGLTGREKDPNHYSKAKALHRVFGLEGVYVDHAVANEDIIIVVDK